MQTPQSLTESQTVMEQNLETILETLESITEEELNAQIYPTQRTIGEIVNHAVVKFALNIRTAKIFLLLRLPFPGKNGHTHPVDASDYHWEPTSGKKRKPKSFIRQDLIKKVETQPPKIMKRYENATEKDTKLLHITTWHVSCHLRQIQTILQALKTEQ